MSSRTWRFCAAICAATVPLAATAEDLVVRIGHVVPLSGTAAISSIELQNSVKLAIDELNSQKQKIAGKNVRYELVTIDDSGDVKQSVRAAKTLCSDRVSAVVGYYSSASAMATSSIYSACGIPQLTPSKISAAGSADWKSTFRVQADDEDVTGSLAKFSKTGLKASRAAIVSDGSAYADDLVKQFIQGATLQQIEVIDIVSYASGGYEDQLSSLKLKRPDVIFYAGTGKGAQPLLFEVEKWGRVPPKILGGSSLCADGPSSASNAASAWKNVICADGKSPEFSKWNFGPDWKTRYSTRYSMPPVDMASMTSYESILAIAKATEASGSTDSKALLARLKSGKYEGGGGEASAPPVYLYTYGSGQKKPLAVSGALNKEDGFPWPPPPWFSLDEVPTGVIYKAWASRFSNHAPNEKPSKLADVDQVLVGALKEAGYGSSTYYVVPGGYAFATSIERFGDDGAPADKDRFDISNSSRAFDLWKFLQSLLTATAGRFRVLVFVVSDVPFKYDQGKSYPTAEAAIRWVGAGTSSLPSEIGNVKLTDGTKCMVLVYEFKKPPGGAASLLQTGLPALQHLRASGILAKLER